jgi:hypothetical protein
MRYTEDFAMAVLIDQQREILRTVTAAIIRTRRDNE